MSQETITRWYVVPNPYTIYACCSCKWAHWGNLCKHQIAIILLTINISEVTFLEFCGTYFGSQRGGLSALFTRPIVDDLIVDIKDDDDDDTNDGKGDMHVDMIGPSQPFDENMQDDDPLTLEVAMNKSMKDHLIVANAIVEECQLAWQLFCDDTTTILHKIYADIHALRLVKTMDFLHPRVVFEKVDDGCPNIEKWMKDWCEKFICKKG